MAAGVPPSGVDSPVCVLPGCPSPVGQWGDLCQGCGGEVGGFLRPTAGPAMTREAIAARDAGVRRAYAMHEQIRQTGFPATDSGPLVMPATVERTR